MNKFILILALFFIAPTSHSQNTALAPGLTQEQLEAELEGLVAARNANKTTELQYSRQLLQTLKKYIPDGYEEHTLAEYRVLLATKLSKKKISREEYDYLWAERLNEYRAKMKKAEDQARIDEEYRQARQNMAEQENTRRAADQARREQAYREQVAAAEAESSRQQQIRFNASFLKGIGNAFRNATPRAPVTCSSLPVGASVSTTCY